MTLPPRESKSPVKSVEGPAPRSSDDNTHHDDGVYRIEEPSVQDDSVPSSGMPGSSEFFMSVSSNEHGTPSTYLEFGSASFDQIHYHNRTPPAEYREIFTELGNVHGRASSPPTSTLPLQVIEANVCCEICGYRPKGDPRWFAGSMAKHKRLQHSNSNPIIFKCPFPGCNSEYKNRRDNLRQHQIEKNHFVGDERHKPLNRKRDSRPNDVDGMMSKAEGVLATTNPTLKEPGGSSSTISALKSIELSSATESILSTKEGSDLKGHNTRGLPSIWDWKTRSPPRGATSSLRESTHSLSSYTAPPRGVPPSVSSRVKTHHKFELGNQSNPRPDASSAGAISSDKAKRSRAERNASSSSSRSDAMMRVQSKLDQSSATDSSGQTNRDEVLTDSEHSSEPDITEMDDICHDDDEQLSPTQEKLLQIVMRCYFATKGLNGRSNSDELTNSKRELSPLPWGSYCAHMVQNSRSPSLSRPSIQQNRHPLSPWLLHPQADGSGSSDTSSTPSDKRTTPNSGATFSLYSPYSLPRAKRTISDSDTTQDPAESKTAQSSNKRQKNKDTRQVLACPYWKLDSEKHRSCCKLCHKRIRDVKQHLHRRHTPEYYCPRCFETFHDSQRYEVHVASSVPCQRQTGVQLDGISIAQNKELRKKSDRKLDEEQQWFAIWDILFPDQTRPCSAYVDLALSEELSSFKEYWTRQGEDILMDEMHSSDLWSLTTEQRESQGRLILRRGLTMIYEKWEETRLSVDPLISDASPSDSSATQLTDVPHNEPMPPPPPDNIDFRMNPLLPCTPFPEDNAVGANGNITPNLEFSEWFCVPNDLGPNLPNQGYDDI
ncbi:hypothetical protein O1611_g3438 [Lasiodiplodia mahajangana]|uniref:Uncharacterized protein n=1 Tax=Lasiodiplodia mahajangana TaxID=1108764 RepID=A0ACC2JRT0_9PEZI|nr:hypothetical protein O1611_g3438 [Lasiodiplodia mahajangana]